MSLESILLLTELIVIHRLLLMRLEVRVLVGHHLRCKRGLRLLPGSALVLRLLIHHLRLLHVLIAIAHVLRGHVLSLHLHWHSLVGREGDGAGVHLGIVHFELVCLHVEVGLAHSARRSTRLGSSCGGSEGEILSLGKVQIPTHD